MDNKYYKNFLFSLVRLMLIILIVAPFFFTAPESFAGGRKSSKTNVKRKTVRKQSRIQHRTQERVEKEAIPSGIKRYEKVRSQGRAHRIRGDNSEKKLKLQESEINKRPKEMRKRRLRRSSHVPTKDQKENHAHSSHNSHERAQSCEQRLTEIGYPRTKAHTFCRQLYGLLE